MVGGIRKRKIPKKAEIKSPFSTPTFKETRDRFRGGSTWEELDRPIWHREEDEKFDAVQDHF